MKMMQTGL